MSEIIQAEYETLEEIAQKFQVLADRALDISLKLERARNDLDGEWEGFGGESFFTEMDYTVLIATRDLRQALTDTSHIITYFRSEFEDSEYVSTESFWDRWGEKIHFGLDVVGFIPGLGEIADGVNALIYLAEGRYVEAGISAAAMIPIWGDMGKLGKWGAKATNEIIEEGAEKIAKEAVEKVSKETSEELAEESAEQVIKKVEPWQSPEFANFSPRQIQKKFDHASDFGINGNYNNNNANLFEEALTKHVHNPNTKPIEGTYRGNIDVIHYYDPATQLNVMVKKDTGEFVSGWKLGQSQIENLLRNGNVQ